MKRAFKVIIKLKIILLILVCIQILNVKLVVAVEVLYNWNAEGDSGTTWDGWTWSTPANDFSAPGWRKNDGSWQSGDSNWMPRIHEKSDYGNDSTATIDTTNRAPNTSSGASLKVYDTGASETYQSCYWYINHDNFGALGKADSTTDRFSFYFKPTGISDPNTTNIDISNGNIHIGTYLCWDDGSPSGKDCPDEAGYPRQHYYHYLTVNDDAWLHVVLDRHPTHQVGVGPSPDLPEDNPADPKDYYEYMNSFYVEIKAAQASVTSYWIDEIELYTCSQNENDISIASVWIGYWVDTDKWEIGFNDNSFNDAGYGETSHSTFEVRYSASPITNENYSSATVTEPEYHERGTTNTFKRPNQYKKPAWTRFTIPDETEASVNVLYFAIKDVSAIASGDGHEAPSAYIHTIDYYLRTGQQATLGAGTTATLGSGTTVTIQ